MQSLEFFLAKPPEKTDREALTKYFEDIILGYLQQDALEKCPRLYQTLIYHWNKDDIATLKQIKIALKCSNDDLEKLYTKALSELYQRKLDLIKSQFQFEPINDTSIGHIKSMIIAGMKDFLLVRGKERVEKQIKSLSLIWHPDKFEKHTATMKWLAERLKPNRCFDLIAVADEQIKYPERYPSSLSINTPNNDLLQQRKTLILKSETYHEQVFHRAILQWYKDDEAHRLFVNALSPQYGNLIHKLSLSLSSAAGLAFFYEEAIVFGGLYGSLALTQWAAHASESPEAKKIERYCEMLKNYLYHGGMSICAWMSSTYLRSETALIKAAVNQYKPTMLPQIAYEVQDKEFHFTPEIKYIADHLQQYIHYQQQQWLAGYRKGADKAIIINDLLKNLQETDKAKLSLDKKLNQVETLLIEASNNPRLSNADSWMKVFYVIAPSDCRAMLAVTLAHDELKRVRYSLLKQKEAAFHSIAHDILLELQAYIDQQSFQVLGEWRPGASKSAKMKEAMTNLHNIAINSTFSPTEKFEKAKKEMLGLASEPAINQSGTKAKDTINHALKMLLAIMPTPKESATSNLMKKICYHLQDSKVM